MRKFEPNDVFYNRVKTFPSIKFFIYNGNIFYNDKTTISGANVSNVFGIPTGYLDLYELNVDRNQSNLIYPFLVKDGSLQSFKSVSTSQFNSDFSYGDIITGSYQQTSATIKSDFFSSTTRPLIDALRNSLNYNSIYSPHFAFSSSLGDKATQSLRLLSLSQIFYGSSIQKGSVSLKFFITGVLAGELRDSRKNGELIQVSGPDSGSVAGVCLYSEGFLVLTGAWAINSAFSENYGQGSVNPRWIDFATTSSSPISSSFLVSMSGTNQIPVLTMFAHAPAGELNFSSNPTFLNYRTGTTAYPVLTGSKIYAEEDELSIKNTVKTPYNNPTGTFRKQVFISSIGIYDKDKNLIGIAKVAKPVRKNELMDLTFKLKMDF
jgi:hypothetical protein